MSEPVTEENQTLDDRRKKGVTEMICKLLQKQGVPDVNVDTFSSHPAEYRYFHSIFREVVEIKLKDPMSRLTILIRFTEGEAKDLIKYCIHLPSDKGYVTTIELLN